MKFQKYEPDTLFTHKDAEGMTLLADLGLSRSFYNSRYGYQTSASMDFSRNAGAVQLYEKNSLTRFTMPKEEYNSISHPIRVNEKITSFGHVERKLMRDVLDDLIQLHPDVKNTKPPSHPEYYTSDSSEEQRELEILENLTNNTQQYREYLENKNLIVKMWSERAPCEELWRDGKGCKAFMNKICPDDSEYGYIGENDEEVKIASEILRRDYLNRFGR